MQLRKVEAGHGEQLADNATDQLVVLVSDCEMVGSEESTEITSLSARK